MESTNKTSNNSSYLINTKIRQLLMIVNTFFSNVLRVHGNDVVRVQISKFFFNVNMNFCLKYLNVSVYIFTDQSCMSIANGCFLADPLYNR